MLDMPDVYPTTFLRSLWGVNYLFHVQDRMIQFLHILSKEMGGFAQKEIPSEISENGSHLFQHFCRCLSYL